MINNENPNCIVPIKRYGSMGRRYGILQSEQFCILSSSFLHKQTKMAELCTVSDLKVHVLSFDIS